MQKTLTGIEARLSKVADLEITRLRDPFFCREELEAEDGTKVNFAGKSSAELAEFFSKAKEDIDYLLNELKRRL